MRRALALALALAALPGSAAPRFGPFATPGNPLTREAVRPAPGYRFQGEGGLFLTLAYDFYRTVVSPTNGTQCVHRPTCSRYALLAVQRHGPVGLLLTMDRLLRGPESSALRLLRFEITEERLLYLDPVEESTFWFSSSP